MYFAREFSTLLPIDTAFDKLKAVKVNRNRPESGK